MQIRRHAPNVYVIKTAQPEEVQRFFEALGLTFQEEKHGKGPTHFSCELNGQVLEIYPEAQHEAAAPVGPWAAAPEFDPALWFLTTDCDGRHFVVREGNPHTSPGRMLAWCPTKKALYCFSKVEMTEAASETNRWVEGFLAGNEPKPPEEVLYNPTSPAGLAWEQKAEAFRSTGFWPDDEPPA